MTLNFVMEQPQQYKYEEIQKENMLSAQGHTARHVTDRVSERGTSQEGHRGSSIY